MNQKEKIMVIKTNESKYGVPGATSFAKRRHNNLKPEAKNSWEHESAKFWIGYLLNKADKTFIAEALVKNTGEIADIVCLDDNTRIEVETTKARAQRFFERKDVLLVPLYDMNDSLVEIEKLLRHNGLIE